MRAAQQHCVVAPARAVAGKANSVSRNSGSLAQAAPVSAADEFDELDPGPSVGDTAGGDLDDAPDLRSDAARIVAATPGDHLAVYPLLTTIFQGPSHDAYQSSLDDPFYEPRDRLLAKHNARTVAHLHIVKRVMQFGPLRLPVAMVRWLGTLPEFRGRGIASRLMRVADQCMIEDGTGLGLLRTKIPHFFRPGEWAVCGRHCVSQARTPDLLVTLAGMRPPAPADDPPRLTVRPWRQVELPSLMRIFRQSTIDGLGTLERTEPYWRWLVSRKAFDQILVAIEGPDRFELDDGTAPIVGYAATRGPRIVELYTEPGRQDVALELVSRAASEALELDQLVVSLDAPPDHPAHELFRGAGGSLWHHETWQGEVFMARLFDPLAFLKNLCGELHRRADRARLMRPCELGLLFAGEKYRLDISRRSVKVARDKLGRGYLSGNGAEFVRLLLGHTDLDEAVAAGRVEATTRAAHELGKVLFPCLPLWYPPLDDLDP